MIVKTSLYVPATSGLAVFFGVTLTLNGALMVVVAEIAPVDVSGAPRPALLDVSRVAVPPLIVDVAT